jgi:hypothetical protein
MSTFSVVLKLKPRNFHFTYLAHYFADVQLKKLCLIFCISFLVALHSAKLHTITRFVEFNEGIKMEDYSEEDSKYDFTDSFFIGYIAGLVILGLLLLAVNILLCYCLVLIGKDN